MNDVVDLDALIAGVLEGDRAILGRAITLVESRRATDRAQARELLNRIAVDDDTNAPAHRVGVTGVPGVGKSTFIEALGLHLLEQGERVGVLAVDPSSARTGGSILGDKTRMQVLGRDPRAFIRPSPAAGSLGGVARNTREVVMLLEAAGYTVILIETVGVGQSETMVADMVDFFLVLMLAGAGDELQGIKRGILELADMLVVNKADGDNLDRARGARAELARVVHMMQPKSEHWRVPVETCSALEARGIGESWAQVQGHREAMLASGEWTANRRRQRIHWMWRLLEEGLLEAFRGDPEMRRRVAEAEAAVLAGERRPELAVDELLHAFSSRATGGSSGPT
jgi:LAO/AO transport system kinase